MRLSCHKCLIKDRARYTSDIKRKNPNIMSDPLNYTFSCSKLPSEKLVISHIFAIALNGIVIIPTLLLNAASVITIFKSSQLNNKPCYFIILVQSVFDLAVGIFGIPLFILLLAKGIRGTSNCFPAPLARRLMAVPVGLSTITTTAMTLERYIAIVHPYAYGTHVTKKRLLVFVVSCATVEVVAISVSLAVEKILQIYSTVKLTSVLFLTAYAYTRIYVVIRKLSGAHKKPNDAATAMNITKWKLFLQEAKQARSCFIVVVCFFVLDFLPPTIVLPFLASTNKFEKLGILTWIFWIGILNSSANSVIFFWTKKMLRKEALKVLKAA